MEPPRSNVRFVNGVNTTTPPPSAAASYPPVFKATSSSPSLTVTRSPPTTSTLSPRVGNANANVNTGTTMSHSTGNLPQTRGLAPKSSVAPVPAPAPSIGSQRPLSPKPSAPAPPPAILKPSKSVGNFHRGPVNSGDTATNTLINSKSANSYGTLRRPDRPPRPKVRVIKPFNASDSEELTLKIGDIILIKETDSNPWGRGVKENDVKEGWFPLECVESITPGYKLPFLQEEGPIVDGSSLLGENRSKSSSSLDKHLSMRPPKEQLQRTNILPDTDASPALQEASKKLEKSKVGDFLSVFLRKKSTTNLGYNPNANTANAPPTATPSSPTTAAIKDEIQFSKEEINFNNEQVEEATSVIDIFEIRSSSSSKTKFSIDFGSPQNPNEIFNALPPSIQISFEPNKGVVTKSKPQPIKVTFHLKTYTATKEVTAIITVGEKNTRKLYLPIKINCKKGIFGADPSTLEMITDPYLPELSVPRVLVELKTQILKMGGFEKEGIFRISGDATTVQKLKKQINNKQPFTCPDVHTLANLIKIWFRELPEPLLQRVTREELFSEDIDVCTDAIFKLPQLQLSLLKWLILLLDLVSKHVKINKMNLENLAIVIAPNLYRMGSDIDAVEGLIRTQKLAKFFHNIVTGYMKRFPSSSKLEDDEEYSTDNSTSSTSSAPPQLPYNNRSLTPNPHATAAQNADWNRRRSQSSNAMLATKSHASPNASPPPLPTSPKPIVKPKPASPNIRSPVLQRHGGGAN